MIIENNSLEEYLSIFSKHKFTIIIFTAICVVFAVFISLSQSDIYEASCYLLVDTDSPNILNVKDVVTLGNSDYRSYQEYLLTQIELIQRKPIAREAYIKLNLNKRFENVTNIEKQNHSMKFYLANIYYSFKNYIKSFYKPQIDISTLKYSIKQQAPSIPVVDEEELNNFQDNISVESIKDTRLLKISYKDDDPELAKDIVNTIGSIFVEKNVQRKINTTKDASNWITQKISILRKTLKEKENKIEIFRKLNNLISADERREIINQSLLDLNKRLIEAEATFSEYKKRYRDEHPKMIQTQALITSLKDMIVNTRESAMQFEQKLVEYNNLIQGVNLTRNLLENLLTRERETLMASTYFANNISIPEEAKTPIEPIGPKRTLNVIMALVFGLLGGFTWSYFKEMLNGTIQGADEILKYSIPFLGNIPYIKGSIFDKKNAKDSYVLFNDKGIISEIFNNLRTNIVLTNNSEHKRGRSMLFTSFLPGEGKTLIACNFAQTLAKFNFKTLLLDVDLRKSRMKNIFISDAKKGLSDYLVGEAKLDEVIHPGPMKNLDILPNIRVPNNPSELLGSETFKKLIEKLEDQYDMIVLDSPPVFAVTDPVLLATIVKKVVIIAQYRSTPKKLIPIVKNKFDLTNSQIIGVILNKSQIEKSDFAVCSVYHK